MNKYVSLRERGLKPDHAILLAALKVCSRSKNLQFGTRIHRDVVENGDISSTVVANTLIDMYSKCGCMQQAIQVFQGMLLQDLVSWTTIVMGYAQNGQGEAAVEAFDQMRAQGYRPNHVTVIAVIKACSTLAGGKLKLRQVHILAAELGYESNTFVGSALVDMYAKLGSMLEAHLAFEALIEQDVVAWTSMIQGYVSTGQEELALDYYGKMQMLGRVAPDERAFVSALKACVGLAARGGPEFSLDTGKRIHEAVVKAGFDSDVFVSSMLVDMYSKCGSMQQARAVFDFMKRRDVVSWTAIIMGYAANGESDIALQLFVQMRSAGCLPNHVTIVAATKACVRLQHARVIHLHANYLGHSSNAHVASSLVDMYARCGSMANACAVFEGMAHKNVVTWTVIIQGCVRLGENKQAMCYYFQLRDTVVPDAVVFVAALKACSQLGNLECGKQVHADIQKHGFERDVRVATSLVDFYGKCGRMVDAESAFSLVSGDSVAWTALVAGYSRQGDVKGVADAFERIKDAGVPPNAAIFLCMLTACSHGGLVEQARQWFEIMWKEYSIAPGVEHYTCVIDLLARSRRLDEAVAMLRGMPFEPDEVAYTVAYRLRT